MKPLLSIAAFLIALLAWAAAVVDFILAKMVEIPRPYLVPARTFYAVYRSCQAYLSGQSTDWQTFRIREYPRPKHF